jgi:hypothetical protein
MPRTRKRHPVRGNPQVETHAANPLAPPAQPTDQAKGRAVKEGLLSPLKGKPAHWAPKGHVPPNLMAPCQSVPHVDGVDDDDEVGYILGTMTEQELGNLTIS